MCPSAIGRQRGDGALATLSIYRPYRALSVFDPPNKETRNLEILRGIASCNQPDSAYSERRYRFRVGAFDLHVPPNTMLNAFQFKNQDSLKDSQQMIVKRFASVREKCFEM